MRIRELMNLDVEYSLIDGAFHKNFDRRGINYEAVLTPFAMTGSACSIIKIDDVNDINNVTAPVDSRTVLYKRFNDFKKQNLIDTIKEFMLEY